MNPEALREYFALGGSAAALASTAYFWFVRANRERMQLGIHPVGSLRGTVIVNEDFETFRRVAPGEGEVCAKYFVDLAVVNHSSLPNALLGLRIKVRMANGSLREMDVRHADPEQVLFPMNLQPLSTAHLPLAIATAVEGSFDGGFAGREMTAGDALAEPTEIKVKLTSLGDKTFVRSYRDDGKALKRSELELAKARSAA